MAEPAASFLISGMNFRRLLTMQCLGPHCFLNASLFPWAARRLVRELHQRDARGRRRSASPQESAGVPGLQHGPVLEPALGLESRSCHLAVMWPWEICDPHPLGLRLLSLLTYKMGSSDSRHDFVERIREMRCGLHFTAHVESGSYY